MNVNEWKLEPTLSSCDQHPEPRYSHGIGQHGHLVYIVGGANDEKVFNDFWAFDLRSLTWHRLIVNLPTPLYFHSAAITPEGEFTIFGGVTSLARKERSNTLYNIWVQIPKLSTLCMQAVVDKLRYDHNQAHNIKSKCYNVLSDDTIRHYFEKNNLCLDYFNVPDNL